MIKKFSPVTPVMYDKAENKWWNCGHKGWVWYMLCTCLCSQYVVNRLNDTASKNERCGMWVRLDKKRLFSISATYAVVWWNEDPLISKWNIAPSITSLKLPPFLWKAPWMIRWSTLDCINCIFLVCRKASTEVRRSTWKAIKVLGESIKVGIWERGGGYGGWFWKAKHQQTVQGFVKYQEWHYWSENRWRSKPVSLIHFLVAKHHLKLMNVLSVEQTHESRGKVKVCA